MKNTTPIRLVNTDLLEQLAKKFNCVSCSTMAYRTKAGTPVILYQYYQGPKRELVAKYFNYGYGRIFQDLLHNISYTDCQQFL